MSDYDETIRSALACLPAPMARRLGEIRYELFESAEDVSSRWTSTAEAVHVELNTSDVTPHDCALELLTCLGQALWELAGNAERRAWLQLLQQEMEAGVEGEIDEPALEEKRAVLSSPVLAASPRRLERYAQAAFAGTAAEYVHSFWHDVEIREGPDYLTAGVVRQRFDWMRNRFPAPE